MVRMNIQFHRFYHIFRFEDSVQVFFGKDVMFKDKFINSLSCFQRFFGYFCRMLVADYRIQCGHYSDTVVHISTAFILIRRDTVDTFRTLCIDGITAFILNRRDTVDT